jgi:hypothetical protein
MRANVDSGKDPVFSAGSTDRLKIRAFASRTQTIVRNYFHRNISPLLDGFKDNRRYGDTEAVAGVLGTAGDKSDLNRRRLSELPRGVRCRVSNKHLILVRTRIIRGDLQFDSVSCIYGVDRLGSDLSIATIATQ